MIERAREAWDFSGEVPWPRFGVRCLCGSEDIAVRYWQFFRTEGTHPYRCDVSFKCCHCSYVMTFGVPVPEESYPGNRRIDHKQVRHVRGV